MNAKDALRGMMTMSDMIMGAYVGDLSDADLMVRPGPGCNHLAWQLGHLIAAEAGILSSISPGAAPELPAGFAEKHDKATIGCDDASQFCSKQEYLDLHKKVRDATLAALDKTPDAELDSPSPERFVKMFPTVGMVYALIASHPLMHAGQFVPVRRALGKPIVI